jgi:hypothetical protein
MSELGADQTAAKHGEACARYQTVLAARIADQTRKRAACTYEWAKNPAEIERSERYQLRALYFQFEAVKGHVNENIPCDGRCYNAKGHNCECQCGGHNHGAGNAAGIGMVA